jgi:hypothetical protein
VYTPPAVNPNENHDTGRIEMPVVYESCCGTCSTTAKRCAPVAGYLWFTPTAPWAPMCHTSFLAMNGMLKTRFGETFIGAEFDAAPHGAGVVTSVFGSVSSAQPSRSCFR